MWGSWEADVLPCDRPDSVKFMLSIHEDIPASQSPTGYSMPGRTLWWHVFNEGEFAVSPWAEGIQEGWLDPPDNYYFPADTVCWQYRFQIPAEEAFEQLGSPNSPVTYWLDLQARWDLYHARRQEARELAAIAPRTARAAANQ